VSPAVITALGTAIAGLLVGVVALVKLIREGPKIRADAMANISAAATAATTEQIASLRDRMTDAATESRNATTEVREAMTELRATRRALLRAEHRIDVLVDYILERQRWDERHPQLYTTDKPPPFPDLNGNGG
jgi:hypothetical protein